ncbi:ABC transporter substrate-binding protein [Yinghuangia seranimata]|uniref:ABC transporter substrate-binding protein n=1 Tax=Yinghuangia seranimata TaxID=408067 RepID=UPI00248C7AB8|nr:ABC transporter substrate-binding protein [Yinghuangia seranimata]MDI2125956.1 ABC transporter substrate-binding protein [Yinghuangia seranimata]
MRTSLRLAAVASAAVLVLAACGGKDPASGKGGGPQQNAAGNGAKGTVTVGLLNPVTGPFAALGTDVNAGFELYLKSKGGVLSGYGVKTSKADEGTDAAQGTTKARQLVEQDKAQVVVGLVNSAIAYAVAPYLEQADVPLLVTVAGADGLTRKQNGNTFRLSYTSSQDSMPLGPYACKDLGYKKAVILGLDYSFGWEAAGGFARTFKDAGCTVTKEIYAPLGTQDWGPYVNQVDKDADVVFAVAPGQDGVRLLKAYRDFGVKVPVIAHGSTVDETILPTEGASAEGVVSSLHYTPQIDSPANKELVKAFSDANGGKSANQYAEEGWAAGMALEAALAQIDADPTPAKIRAALAKVKIDAPRGPVLFDAYGQAIYPVYMRKVESKDGKRVNSVVSTVPNVTQFFTYDPQAYLAFPGYDKLKGSWAK